MELFKKKMRPVDERDIRGRLAALEDYVEYLRQQGETGMDRVRRGEERRDNNEHVQGEPGPVEQENGPIEPQAGI